MAFGRKGDAGERSAEERARAAAERAARRAQPPPPAETFQDARARRSGGHGLAGPPRGDLRSRVG